MSESKWIYHLTVKNLHIICFCHKITEKKTPTEIFSPSESQCAINVSITFSVSNLHVTLFLLWPTFHLSHSFNDTLSFICTAAVRPDHLQGTQTHQLSAFA